MVKVMLMDGSIILTKEESSIYEIAVKIGTGLARKALAARLDGKVTDLMTKVKADCSLEILTFDDPEGRGALRHTASHILAQAVKRLYPASMLAIGPAIENGFYYDFDMTEAITPAILDKIEIEMGRIVKENYELERFVLPKEEAIKLMTDMKEPYKVELIEALPEAEEISFYKQGEYIDLCAGPHVPSTSSVKVFKLLAVAGAYWKGNENNKMLQRIYGTAFTKKGEMDEYLIMQEEAKKRDHRKLGRELDLFSIQEEGPGFPFFHPKGMIIRNILEDYWREIHRTADYQEIKTPIILNESLWHRSGHWEHYSENMYLTKIDDENYTIKPMNCPGSILIYKNSLHSYRELPLRLGELGLVHRHELSGALHGLMRVRCFTQDDAHIFMTREQVKSEIVGIINLIDSFYKSFDFKYTVELSTKPENSMGSEEEWEIATNALIEAMEAVGLEYKVNEGDGAFYGPKIDFHIRDSIGRAWQCGTIQLDFQMPERFELVFIGPDGEKHTPVMLHRVLFGSIERFIGILIEHYAGAFPSWLSPVQVKVISIGEHVNAYSSQVADELKRKGFRIELDLRNEKVGFKIREAQLMKIPYMLVLGEKELNEQKITVRSRKQGDLGSMNLNEFIYKFKEEVDKKEA
jgi:threonyl-tRNA synthetase